MNSVFSFDSLPSFEEIENKSAALSLFPEKFMVDEDLLDRDYRYKRELCPPSMLSFLDQMEDLCDRLEYEGSFLYDEAPDKATIYKLSNQLALSFSDSVSEMEKELILLLLLEELFSRRSRFYQKQNMFQ